MSLFPIALWKPTPKDLVADFNPAQIALLNGSTAAAAQITSFSGQGQAIPADKLLLVSSAFAVAVPGAAQFVTRIRLRWGLFAGGAFTQALGDLSSTGTIAGAVLAELAREWVPGPPGFVLASDQCIAATVDFNAGAAANTVSMTVNGVLIPRANWQRA